jgi:hypothetical protein
VVFSRFDTLVRCRDGHLFTTVWMPRVSVKAARLGNGRWQHCPVGKHWSMVVPVDERTLDPAAVRAARAVHDIHLP